MRRALYKPFPDERTCSVLRTAILNEPLDIDICDERDQEAPCFPGTATLYVHEDEYWFRFVADHDPAISFREPREMVLQWLRRNANPTPPPVGVTLVSSQ